ncbi:MAG: dTDP-4-dehydrorhamnose reductase [Pseudomonadota bacterium]|nr:dTDP-4-dehydrorhamnose reductase [Pseudomonadota bacterium]
MNILLTGANGQVGREVAQLGRDAGHQVLARGHGELDISDAAMVDGAVANDVGVVVNAAAYTAVDRAEQEPAAAFAVNRDGPAHLAAACRDRGIPLLHISTDYVFDGSKDGPYTEDDPAAPLGIYGQSKWEGEEAIRRRLEAHLILRVSWVFGIHGNNFVKTMLRLARERDELRVVADQRGCPTYAAAIAAVLVGLVDRLAAGRPMHWGTFHYCGTPPTTWHGFAEAIVGQGRGYEDLKARRVAPIATADYPTPARRPANSVLDAARILRVYGVGPPPWRQGLEHMLRALHAARS